jgi:hypothetical protein
MAATDANMGIRVVMGACYERALVSISRNEVTNEVNDESSKLLMTY